VARQRPELELLDVGATRPELCVAMAAAPERDRAGPERQPWRRAAIRAAVLKGAALPSPPPF